MFTFYFNQKKPNIMKRIVLCLAVITFIISSCGGNGDKKDTTKEVKKEARLSKSTQEGMMQVIEECNLTVHESLNFLEVAKESDSFKIRFLAENVNDETKLALENWYNNQVEKMEGNGWKKMVMVENQEAFGLLSNEMTFLKPQGSKVNVTYGVTLTSTYDADKKTYKYTFAAN